ncbi:MAG: hypothetical protein K2G00_00385, partial [Duncaniella sp.]|nr:hypothetical protein [Duncaniella sp.]MDE6823599.1 hypothetical protein [Duncaniella sp.]
ESRSPPPLNRPKPERESASGFGFFIFTNHFYSKIPYDCDIFLSNRHLLVDVQFILCNFATGILP